jgi:LacI family transcriptional regulator
MVSFSQHYPTPDQEHAPKMASIKTIAQLAGTSVTTVSRVMNNSGYVSNDVRTKVEHAIAATNYRPSTGARVLRSGKSDLVGILLPSLDVQFFGILAHTMEQALFDLGYQSFICSTAESAAHEARYISTFISRRVGGVIAASAQSGAAHFAQLQDSAIPIVAIDRDLNGLESDAVVIDHDLGGRMMAAHLMDLGHRQIAILGAPAHSQSIQRRLAGVTALLDHNGLAPSGLELGPQHNFDETYRLAKRLLMATDRPTAIIGLTDIAAIGAIHAAHDLGLSVPQDLSIIGFDDIPSAAFVLPRLTTIAQPIRQLGRSAVARLHRLMTHDQTGAVDPVPELKLILRETTAPPRVR